MENADEVIAGLNEGQRKAVLHDHALGGELLVLAGAGSGIIGGKKAKTFKWP